MQNQTKPKPLGASMAKLVLVVAIIVCLGVVLGVAGYLAGNKSTKIQQPQVLPAPEPTDNISEVSQSVKAKIDQLIAERINSEDKINVIIDTFNVPNQEMVKTLQNIGAENIKIIESEPIKKEGIETVTKDAEPLFITATIKTKNAISIAELSWIRKITLNIEMISQ